MPGLHFPAEFNVRFFDLPLHQKIRIGRDPTCEVFLADPRISRLHAEIEATSTTTASLRNLSANGTEINRLSVEDTTLKNGDQIRMGRFSFIFCVQRPPTETNHLTQKLPPLEIIGQTPAIQRTLHLCQRAAHSDFPVLLQGETGAGKELFAKFIHDRSPRAPKPLVIFNCATFSPNLMESELFGYKRGAFTGATESKKGLLQTAHTGSLFLDEIGEMPLALQAKMLRVLEEKKYRPLGNDDTQFADVRFIAATNRNLLEEIEKGGFRRDLFHRLSVLHIEIPPLRQRKGDIAPLAEHFLSQNGLNPFLSPEVITHLCRYDWPGNVRELRNVLIRAAILKEQECLEVKDIVFDSTLGAPETHNPLSPWTPTPLFHNHTMTGGLSLKDQERELISKTLLAQDGSRKKTADILGISRSSLFLKMREYGIRGD